MKRLLKILILLAPLAITCNVQGQCTAGALPQAAARVIALQLEIEQIKVGEMEEGTPPAIANKITYLKDALSHFSDIALVCAGPSIDPLELEKHLADLLHANAPEPAPNTVISASDHRYDEILGSYGHNLRVQVSRSANVPGVLAIRYSINIECGADNMLLVYELQDGAWTEKLRWQSPQLKEISDAFGDFFLSAFLRDSTSAKGDKAKWQVVVAHGTPWCTSRFSGFKIDLLSAGFDRDGAAPQVLWHAERGYSRGGFDPRLKSSGNTFELRLNADCMSFDNANCFERRVIYRYTVDDNGRVHRVNPLGINARGFVEEWLSAPWSESKDFSVGESISSLQTAHELFNPPSKPGDDQFVGHSFGPIRACATQGVFQVQMNSTLERTVPGKPGGESKPLPSNYFHVREVKDGYLMLSAPTEPDPTCARPNLAPTDAR
jgi:hypothetical protein